MAIPNICSAKQGNYFESADLKFKHTHLFQSLDAQIKAIKYQNLEPRHCSHLLLMVGVSQPGLNQLSSLHFRKQQWDQDHLLGIATN